MKKVQEFFQALDNPSQWANRNGIPPWLVSRIRKGKTKFITTKYVPKIIQAAKGALALEDFGEDEHGKKDTGNPGVNLSESQNAANPHG